jgi:hypothetical protein
VLQFLNFCAFRFFRNCQRDAAMGAAALQQINQKIMKEATKEPVTDAQLLAVLQVVTPLK